MLSRADGRGFPLIEVPVDTTFEAISRVVLTEALPGDGPRQFVQIFNALNDHLVTGADSIDLFHRLEEITGYRFYGISLNGRSLHPSLPLPPVDSVTDLHLRSPRMPVVSGGFAVPVHAASRAAGYLIAIGYQPGQESGLKAAQIVSTVLGLELTSIERQNDVRREEAEETLRELLALSLDEDAARRRLKLAGFREDDPFMMLAIEPDGDMRETDFRYEWESRDLPFLMWRDEVLYALVPSGEEPLDFLDAPWASDVHAGGSQPLSSTRGLPLARREAMWGLQHAVLRDVSYVVFPREESHEAWLPADSQVLQEIVNRILGPVIEYDSRRNGNLLSSLRVWLKHDRALDAASRALSIHKHTLSYRLRKVETLTDRRLTKLSDLVDLSLAIQAFDILQVPGTADQPFVDLDQLETGPGEVSANGKVKT
jgi:PucR-like helix-turn-helix protein